MSAATDARSAPSEALTTRRTAVLEGVSADAIPFDELVEAQRPTVLKGVARDWPLVRRGLRSAQAAADYLRTFDSGRPAVCYVGDPAIGGRFHYNEDLTAMNFAAERRTLSAFLDRILENRGDAAAPALYVGSTDIDTFLPGFRAENDLKLSGPVTRIGPPLASIWIGNRTIAAAHHDMSNNIACCMVGRRRFTLFPPQQVANLYPGPLEPTPGGQVVTMVDFRAPDLARFPRFAEAIAAAEVAELEPGDVLVYPALWWHQVEALDAFNVMINYWWNAVPDYMDTPADTLLHALLSLRDRPASEKQGWRALFDYYIFGPTEGAVDHLPAVARGDLAGLDPVRARRLRAKLLGRLNR